MNRFERWSVWGTSILVAVSGSGYLWTKYFLEPAGPFAVVNHPLEPWFLRIHVLSAPFFVFAMGLITVKHVWKHYRSGVRLGRKSGLASLLTLIPMVLSGYLIQVMTARGWLTAMAVGHIVVSFLFLAALAAHQWAVSKSEPPPRRRPRSRRDRGATEEYSGASGGSFAGARRGPDAPTHSSPLVRSSAANREPTAPSGDPGHTPGDAAGFTSSGR